jgi:hypothetical protein
VYKGYLGECYGDVTPEAEDAVKLMEEVEGIELEGTYTGKTVAAMLRNIPYDPDAPTLYLHTYNSVDCFSPIPDDLDLSALPPSLRKIAQGIE